MVDMSLEGQRRAGVHQVAGQIFTYGVVNHLQMEPGKPRTEESVEKDRASLRSFARQCCEAAESWFDVLDERIKAAHEAEAAANADPLDPSAAKPIIDIGG